MLFTNLKYQLKKHYRQGARYKRHYDEMASSIHYDSERIKESHDRKLSRLIRHCYEKVPFYHALFETLGITPDRIQTTADLPLLPTIDKYILRENQERFRAKGLLSVLNQKAYTSGTTGTPVSLLRDYNSINYENAAIWCYWNQVGDQGNRRITLRGEIVTPTERTEPPFWKYNPANQELLMSSYHLSLENAEHYIGKIREFQPDILYCYPSTGALLSKLFLQKGIPYKFKAVFTSSESLNTQDLDLIESTFQTRVYDWYGQAERVAAIFRCASGSYHIHESYSHVELIESSEHQGLFELVGTNLNNYAMPLLRYKTHDLVKMADPDFKCSCGSSFRVVETLIGRKPNYIVTPDERRIGNATANILKGMDEIIEAQFYQGSKDAIKLFVIPSPDYSPQVREKLVRQVKRYTSPLMAVEIVEVDHIERGPNGKFVSLVSDIQ